MEDTHLTRLLSVIEEKLSKYPERLSAIKEIALNIKSTGMNVSDSALLSRITDEELDVWQSETPEITTLFRLKRLEFKQALLRTIYTQATANGDVKMAQYMLEKNFSEEFDSSVKRELVKKKPVESNDDVLDQLKNLVRSSAPQSPVNETSNLTADELNDSDTEIGMPKRDDDFDVDLRSIVNHG